MITLFEQWIKDHNPKEEWDFKDMANLTRQFNDNIQECGHLDVATIKKMFDYYEEWEGNPLSD